MGEPAKKFGQLLTALVANRHGEIFELDGYAAVGMAGVDQRVLSTDNTLNMPYGSELMLLPQRRPVLYNLQTQRYEMLNENPFDPGEPVYPVAAFNSPGYVVTGISAFKERQHAGFLPLFAYGAVGWYRGKFRVAAFQVDRERRQDLRLMKQRDIVAGIREKRRLMPDNRLRQHLEKCAQTYGCPAGKNFFLGRYEAPLPTSQHCNARCLGCISLQHKSGIPHSQERIGFVPTPEEIAQVALAHIKKVKKSVVSFGQGCEGDPLLAVDVIEPAIRMIRAATDCGTINLNTNGSRPELLEKLFDAGLDSMRISLNSVRKSCYNAYFRPKGYRFADVVKGIDAVLRRDKFISINYLNSPGFTDSPEEFNTLIRFIQQHPIRMIQWRNLNFDPVRYWQKMATAAPGGKPLGIRHVYSKIRRIFPRLRHGYFNPSKENF
jgi:pyruvate-formate lyase-activating enzyme